MIFILLHTHLTPIYIDMEVIGSLVGQHGRTEGVPEFLLHPRSVSHRSDQTTVSPGVVGGRLDGLPRCRGPHQAVPGQLGQSSSLHHHGDSPDTPGQGGIQSTTDNYGK